MAKKKRYYSNGSRGMMAKRDFDEMGHGSTRSSERAGFNSGSVNRGYDNRGYDNRGYDGMNRPGYYSEGMNRRYDNSDPVPNTVSGLERRESYSGYKESRRMVARDGAMIREDMSAPALLPQRVIDEYWPRAANYHMGYVDDLFYGAQKQMHEDYADFGREMEPKKY